MIFNEVRRILRDDGTLWLNVGDSYNAYNGGAGPSSNLGKTQSEQRPQLETGYGLQCKTLKPKELLGIPWMLAFALRGDGWYLRADNVWGKPNGMPESVSDRTTKAHEYVFHFSKSERYWYDAEAVRTAPKASTETRLKQNVEDQIGSLRANGGGKTRRHALGDNLPIKQRRSRWDQMERENQMSDGANLRSVWWISPAQYAEAHFAVMPEKLAAICILAGCPIGGTVLDPFFGAGTVGAVARCQNSRCIGIELNPSYCQIAVNRLSQAILPFGGEGGKT
jgi:DNA modification methylase